MKSTGIVRNVDGLGRIVIPAELRKTLSIMENTPLEIFTDGGAILLKKFEISCIFCSSPTEIIDFKGKKICKKCLGELYGKK